MLIHIIKETRFRKRALAQRRADDKRTILQSLKTRCCTIKSRDEIMAILVPSKYNKHQISMEEIQIIVRQMTDEGLVKFTPDGMVLTEKAKAFIEESPEKI